MPSRRSDARWARLPWERGLIRAGWEQAVTRALDPAAPREVLKETSWRTVWRVGDVVVKRFPWGPVGWFPDWLGAYARAQREFRALVAADAAGIDVPQPLARVIDAAGAHVATAFVEGARVWKSLLAGGAAHRGMFEAIGRYVRRIHDAGLRHDDLHAGNLLWRELDGRFFLLDWHRARVGAVSTQDRVDALAFLLLSLQEFVSTADAARVVAAYFGGGDAARWAREVERTFLALRHAFYARRAARCHGDGSAFRRVHTPGRSGVARRQAAVPDRLDGVPVKLLAKRWLLRLPNGQGAKVWFARGRGRRQWRHAEALRVRGIPTPRFDAWWREPGREIAVFEWLEGAEPLWEYVAARYAGWSRQERNAFIARLAHLVRKMHDRGASHGDLKANNILVRDGRFALVDLERVWFGPRVPRRRAEWNLGQLNAAVGAPVTRVDRLRFLRAYAGRSTEWNRDFRGAARRIYALTVARRHRWPGALRRLRRSAPRAAR